MKNTRCVFKMHNYTTLLNNEVKYNPYTWVEWTVAGAGSTKGADGVHLVAAGSTDKCEMVTAFKNNTKYGILVNVLATTLNSTFIIGATGAPTVTGTIPQTIGNNKLVFTTLNPITTNRVTFSCAGTNTDGTYIDFKDIRIFELPTGSQIEADFTNLTADQLNTKYPYASFPNTIVMDRSRYLNNGTLSGGAVYKLLPAPLYVLDFTSATSLVTVPKNASINDMAQFTVRGWFYYGGAGGANAGRIIDKNYKKIYVNSVNHQLNFTHVFSTSQGSWFTPVNGLVVGNFYMFQLSYDNTNVANNPVIMIDGLSKTITGSAPVGTALVDNASDLILGNLAIGNRSLNGYLSEIEIYQGILSVAEGKRFYNQSCRRYGKAVVV